MSLNLAWFISLDSTFNQASVTGTPASYLAERGDAEVETVQVVPALPLGKHDGARQQVHHHHPHASRRRNYHLSNTKIKHTVILKVPSGQIGSAWEWYHWKAL